MYFWLLLLAHGTADFIFQTDAVSAAKCRNQWQGYALHGLAIFGCTGRRCTFSAGGKPWRAAAAGDRHSPAAGLAENLGRTVLAQVLKRPERPGLPRVVGWTRRCTFILCSGYGGYATAPSTPPAAKVLRRCICPGSD